MNQDDSDPDIEKQDKNVWIDNQRQFDNLPYYVDYQNENSESDEESKVRRIEREGNPMAGIQLIGRLEQPLMSNIYEQRGNLDDPYEHLARVQRRQKMLIDQVASPFTQQ